MKICHIVGVGLALAHGSDGRNVELLIRPKNTAWQNGGHGQSGGQHGGVANKRSAVDRHGHDTDFHP